MSGRLYALAALILLADCGGGGASAPAAPPAKGATFASGPLTQGSLTLVIANSGSTGSAKKRSPAFVSTHSASLGVLVGSAAEVFIDISGTSPNCTTANGARTCTLTITAPAGQPTILLATFDGPNGTGNMLAQGSIEPTITAGQTWTASATMAPIASALSGGALTYPSDIPFVIGTASTATATISADDPDGTLIPATTVSFANAITLSSSDPHITVAPVWPGFGSTITVAYDGSAAVAPTVNITFSKGSTTLSQIPFSPIATAITEFSAGLTSASEPVGLALGSDHNIWFVEQTGNNVARITTAGVITEFAIPTINSAPTSVAAGSDGALWFTESNNAANKIGRITTGGAITEFSAGISAFAIPENITSNPDGNLYFTEFSTNKIARITTGGVVTEFNVPTPGSQPNYIVSGPDGALWFTEQNGNKIGRMTTTGVFSETTIPTGASLPSGIGVGPDGALWFLEESGTANKVGRITTAGVITNEFTIPTATSHPMTIATGADGNLWFTENNTNKVSRMTTAGVFTEYVIPTPNSGPCSLALGSDNNIWFAENNVTGNKIGRI